MIVWNHLESFVQYPRKDKPITHNCFLSKINILNPKNGSSKSFYGNITKVIAIKIVN